MCSPQWKFHLHIFLQITSVTISLTQHRWRRVLMVNIPIKLRVEKFPLASIVFRFSCWSLPAVSSLLQYWLQDSIATRRLVLKRFKVMSMYLRVKRKNTTTLLHVEPSDSFQLIKQRIATLFSVESHQVMLLGGDKRKELVELATVSDQGKLIFNPLLISPSMLFFCSCCVFSA